MLPVASSMVIVTGAGVRLGRAIALSLARQSFTVGLHYNRSVKGAEELAAEIAAQGGQGVLLPADLREPIQIEKMFEAVDRSGYRLGGLVNSAAVMPQGRLSAASTEEWENVMNLNLRAPWLCAQQAARRMTEGGSIVNISDVGARKNWTGYGAYVISKSALETLTRLLARELAPAITVNAVAPGLILPAPHTSTGDWNTLVDRLPLRRAGKPEDIARTVIFLLTNPYITGEVVTVDGGYQLK